MLSDTRSEFALRDPGALSALLSYDWRVRLFLTDAEIIGSSIQPGAVDDEGISTSVLRHLQRLRCVTATHGVRPHGGRMRLWPLEEVLRIQAIMDLRALSGTKFGACCEALKGPAKTDIDDIIRNWERYVSQASSGVRQAPAGEGYAPELLKDHQALVNCVEASVRRFITRNDFAELRSPAFLL